MTVSSTEEQKCELVQAVEVIPERFFFAIVTGTLSDTPQRHCFSTDESLRYIPFFADFGPLNLSCLFRFCQDLRAKLTEYEHSSVVYYCSPNPACKANSAALVGAYQVIYLDKTPLEAYACLQAMEPFIPFRDACFGPCPYELSVLHCLQAVYKAKKFSFFDFETFDPEEYEYFETVENGDLNIIVPDRFLAFSGPHRTKQGPNGYPQMIPEDYFPIWQRYNVKAVVRLNKKMYERQKFLEAGYHHYDFYFDDGTVPTEELVQQFLTACERETGCIAVHCKAGLGRTGTLIACYMMKHYKWTAEEAIGWLRICRPGSVIGPQQDFVVEQQSRMWQQGEQHRRRHKLSLLWDEEKEAREADAVAKVAREFAKVTTNEPVALKRSVRIKRQNKCRKDGVVVSA